MRAEEIMIGDWVLHKDIPIKVEEILCGCINPDWCCGELMTTIGEDEISPIPLTQEILEKNFPEVEGFGFDLAWGESSLTIKNEQRLLFYIDIDRSLIGINGTFSYVHELQHALKLCHIEKEIVL